MQATVDLIHHLRDTVLPAALAGTDIQVHVGGVTASFDDVATKLQDRLPLFIGVVLALSFLLLHRRVPVDRRVPSRRSS